MTDPLQMPLTAEQVGDLSILEATRGDADRDGVPHEGTRNPRNGTPKRGGRGKGNGAAAVPRAGRKHELVGKARALRERADSLDAEIARRSDSGMGDHFLGGPGGASSAAQRRNASGTAKRRDRSDERTWEMMRERDELRGRASQLEATANKTAFADDPDGVRDQIAQKDKEIESIDKLLAKDRPPLPREVLQAERRSIVKKRVALRKRLSGT